MSEQNGNGKLNEIVGVQEVAAFLNISTKAVLRLFATGQLPGRKVARRWKTTRGLVLRWLEHECMTRAGNDDQDAIKNLIRSGKIDVRARK